MKLTSSSEDLATNKVLILHVLNKINTPIGNDDLFNLILTVEEMNYFYFQQFLVDLLENKYIIDKIVEDKALYSLTPLGLKTLDLTLDILPGILKLKVDQYVKPKLDSIQEAVSITSEFIPTDEKNYTVKCKITENNMCIFEVKTFANSRNQAKLIADNWKDNAEQIYPKMLELLNTKINPN